MKAGTKEHDSSIKESNFLLDEYLNGEITALFKDAIKIILKEPSLAAFFLKAYRQQKKSWKTQA